MDSAAKYSMAFPTRPHTSMGHPHTTMLVVDRPSNHVAMTSTSSFTGCSFACAAGRGSSASARSAPIIAVAGVQARGPMPSTRWLRGPIVEKFEPCPRWGRLHH